MPLIQGKDTSPINEDAIYALNEQIGRTGKCPFSQMPAHFNKVVRHMHTDKLPGIKKGIASMIRAVLDKCLPRGNSFLDEPLPLSRTNELKVKKHVIDVAFLQEELYALIQKQLEMGYPAFLELRECAEELDLHDTEARKAWGEALEDVCLEITSKTIYSREKSQSEDSLYAQLLPYAHAYADILKGRKVSFAHMMTNGINDGFTNIRSLVNNIPMLYEKKHKRMPTAQEYRSLIEKNIKNVIVSLSSISLNFLIYVVRPEEKRLKIKIGDEVAYIVDESDYDALDINSQDFELDDNGLIHITNSYITKRNVKIDQEVLDAERRYNQGVEGFESGYQMATGCPALTARTKDGKRVVEQFCEDILKLLDKVYFPYRDK